MRLFSRLYGRHPLHLVGHVLVIAITAYVLSIIFQARFAPEPLNLALWLLGGAVLHDGVFLPVYGVLNALYARAVGASDERPLKELAMGPTVVAEPPNAAAHQDEPRDPVPVPSRDARRRVPVVNHLRTPFVVSAVLFLVFLPRILNQQPQNFVNALGHAPPDFFARWVFVTLALFAASGVLYAVRLAAASRAR